MTGYVDDGAVRRHTVSQRVRSRRRSLGLTQREVAARLARVGVVTSNRAVSTLERGAGVDVGKLPELAHCLECSVTYLLGLTDDPQQWTPDAEAAEEGVRRAGVAVEEPRGSRRRAVPPRNSGPEPRPRPLVLGPDVPDLGAPVPEGG